MGKLVVTKVDAVRRQLSAAVRMLFANEDPVPIHTVVSAGFRIARDLVEHRQVQSVRLIERIIKPEMRREFWRVFNAPANFFKHADSDPEATLDYVDEEVNDFVLFIAILYYEALGEQKTVEMLGYQCWFIASYPKFFPIEWLNLFLVAGLDNFSSMDRSQRLQQGPLALEAAGRLSNVSKDAK